MIYRRCVKQHSSPRLRGVQPRARTASLAGYVKALMSHLGRGSLFNVQRLIADRIPCEGVAWPLCDYVIIHPPVASGRSGLPFFYILRTSSNQRALEGASIARGPSLDYSIARSSISVWSELRILPEN